ncbi:hypothetical protein PTSG_01198 [Salpingoeca rosetta]|uniref:Uncharacterized protein n=1 Tax=Salpingoeca rosetta (strain ATCC 50818 / BSB-021) TaxID=946362 RepID=F2U135_SALR5|nr:uncharacterized protein PTSG_01198 [Salpingoeca rosetta]EGD80609.1 hypothetical protein PTSG_01198 [Salpingoeca rosetta]|eukprot:XP_004997170.1 hypothetical protein PTSG_01198 [Salpingoeca rosetta]
MDMKRGASSGSVGKAGGGGGDGGNGGDDGQQPRKRPHVVSSSSSSSSSSPLPPPPSIKAGTSTAASIASGGADQHPQKRHLQQHQQQQQQKPATFKRRPRRKAPSATAVAGTKRGSTPSSTRASTNPSPTPQQPTPSAISAQAPPLQHPMPMMSAPPPARRRPPSVYDVDPAGPGYRSTPVALSSSSSSMRAEQGQQASNPMPLPMPRQIMQPQARPPPASILPTPNASHANARVPAGLEQQEAPVVDPSTSAAFATRPIVSQQRTQLRVLTTSDTQDNEFKRMKVDALLSLLDAEGIQEHVTPLLCALRLACRTALTPAQATSVLQLVVRLSSTSCDADTMCLLLATAKQVLAHSSQSALPRTIINSIGTLALNTHDQPLPSVRRRALSLLPFCYAAASHGHQQRHAPDTSETPHRRPSNAQQAHERATASIGAAAATAGGGDGGGGGGGGCGGGGDQRHGGIDTVNGDSVGGGSVGGSGDGTAAPQAQHTASTSPLSPPTTATSATEAAGQLTPRCVTDAITLRLQDEDPRVRSDALIALRQLLVHGLPPAPHHWPLLKALLGDKRTTIRQHCLECLAVFLPRYQECLAAATRQQEQQQGSSGGGGNAGGDEQHLDTDDAVVGHAGNSSPATTNANKPSNTHNSSNNGASDTSNSDTTNGANGGATSQPASAPAPPEASAAGAADAIVNDAFVSLCDLATDISSAVRAATFRALSHLRGVSPEHVLQTLDKKLMSHLRTRKSAHEALKEKHGTTKRAVEQALSQQPPQGDIDVHDISIMSAGACGAFIHGLEDEIHEVRLATLETIRVLALNYKPLALKSLDFLVDMFNDDIDRVRVCALRVMTDLSAFFTLQEEQVDMMLGILDDGNATVRHSAHRLFGASRVVNHNCLHVIVASMLAALARYPEDHISIFHCLRRLGASHPTFTAFLCPTLLGFSPHVLSAAAGVEDRAYVALLCLVCGASASQPRLLRLLPSNVIDHWQQLAVTLPQLFSASQTQPRPTKRQRNGSDRGSGGDGSGGNVLLENKAALRAALTHLQAGQYARGLKCLHAMQSRLHGVCSGSALATADARVLLLYHYITILSATFRTHQHSLPCCVVAQMAPVLVRFCN